MNDERVYNPQHSSEQLSDDFQDCPEALSLVAALFRETYPSDLRDLRMACQARDSRRIAFLAHKIKGTVLVFHQDGAALAAARLEERAGRGDLTEVEGLLERLVEAFDTACSTVDEAEKLLGLGIAD